MKKSSITHKSIRRLAILGIIIFLGTAMAAAFSYYRQSMKTYRDMADAYVDMAATNIYGDKVSQILDNYEDLMAIQRAQDTIYDSMWMTDKDGSLRPVENADEKLEKLKETTQDFYDRNPELEKIGAYWEEISVFFTSGQVFNERIKAFYVVVPMENKKLYIWRSASVGAEENDVTMCFEPYRTGEKEYLEEVMAHDWDRSLVVYRDQGYPVATAMSAVYDADKEENVAVAALDVSLVEIRRGVVALVVNIMVIVLLIMLVSVIVYYRFMHAQIISPLLRLKRATVEVAQNLENGRDGEFSVDVHTGDEIEELARSIETMDARLRKYILENAEILKDKARMVTELQLASNIQSGMLPDIFPPFPDQKEFDLYASMDPAREVGGDFYDFFLVDSDHLALVIADVSGKGIPAALFMMVSEIMIRNYVLTGLGPKTVLETVNEQLCKNNKQQMFVTVWLGILQISTGIVTAVNAGHEYPFLKEPGGTFKLIKDRHGFIVGGMSGVQYTEYEMCLKPGSALFVYTDGLPEATNAKEELYGTERTEKALNEVCDGTPEQILSHVKKQADAFVGDAPQFDDLTMLCITYYGPKDK